MDFSAVFLQLLSGFGQTCLIFFVTLILSMPLGLLVYFARSCRFKVVRGFIKVYISIMRGTPLMLQLLIWYFAPFYLAGADLKGYKFIALSLAFAFNYAAYFAEIYRSGIESIPIGQSEAAKILGFTKGQTFTRIILPQMFKRVLPAITNEVITLVKDTSLVYSISYIEMFALAKQIAAQQTTIIPFIVAGLFYFAFNALVAFVMARIEKKLSYYR